MAEFDISYTTSYQSAIVTIALSCTIFELFDMKECRDFEGHSKSVADTHTSSYSHSIITIVSKITIFHTSFYVTTPLWEKFTNIFVLFIHSIEPDSWPIG